MEALTVACVNVGNYLGCGEEYVRRLKAGVARHLSVPHRFVCFTDAPIDGIECLRSDLQGWWAKLAMFDALKGRVLYFDLDTVITGDLDAFAAYDGDLAVLRDFYRPQGYGSGMMLWNGDHSRIWREWCEAGQPKPEGGDQIWMERYPAERIQDRYSDRVASFKVEGGRLHDGVSVMCFHGRPRPHEVVDCEWVARHWGGPVQRLISGFESGLNTPTQTMIAQAEINLARDLPLFVECPPNANKALIVGGGPSLARSLPNLRMQQERGAFVFALNGAHDYLLERGIVPDFHVMLDAREDNVRFVRKPQKGVTYLMAAQCHPAVFDALNGQHVIMWVSCMDYGERELAHKFRHKPIAMVGGGATVGLKTMGLVHLSGFRKQHLYGFDSSYEDGANHAYPQDLNDRESRIEVTAAGRTFVCAPWMAKQAHEFQWMCRLLEKAGTEIYVHGDGLIPWIARQWAQQQEAA